METLRLVEGKVSLLNTQAIYEFMKNVVNYNQYLCEQNIEPTKIEVSTGRFKLIEPFVDRTVPISSIKEFVWVIGLDSGGYAYYIDLISIGSISKALIDVGEVFRGASHHAIANVILVHNHPMGDPHPSEADIGITERVIEAGMILNRPLLDHLIICPETYYSLVDNKIMHQLTDSIIARRGKEDELYKTILQKDEDLQQKDEDLLEAYKEIERLKLLLKNTKGAG